MGILLLIGRLGVSVAGNFNCGFAPYEGVIPIDYVSVLIVFLMFEVEILIVFVNTSISLLLLIVLVTV